MTDTFGAAVGAAHIAHRAIEYAVEYHHAPKEMKAIAKQMLVSTIALEQVQNLFEKLFPDQQEYQRLLSNETSDDSNATTDDMGIQDLMSLVDMSVKKYKEYAETLHSSVNKGKISIDRLKWHWTSKKIKEDVTQIREFEDSFRLMLSTLQARSIQDIKADTMTVMATISELKSSVRAYEGRQIFEECLNWLPSGPIDIDQKLGEERSKTKDSKPKWVVQDRAYLEWDVSTALEKKWLWAFGDPGAGKTCVASFIADNLRRPHFFDDPTISSITRSLTGSTISADTLSSPRLPDSESSDEGLAKSPTVRALDSERGVAIFFCSYKIKDRQDPDTILKTLIRQLLMQLQNIQPRRAYERIELVDSLRTGKMRGDREGLRRILEKISSDFKDTVIIVDALDENASGFGDLLQSLKLLRTTNLKIFVTSRDGNDGSLRRHADSLKALQLTVNPNDDAIVDYARARLKRIAARDDSEYVLGSALPDAIAEEKELDRITDKIREAARGNFLCAELQITALKGFTDPDELEEHLEFPAASLEDLVRDAIKRVQDQPSARHREVGMKTLMWAIYARTTLTVTELQEVLAIDIYSKVDERRKFGKQLLIESTRYFLSIDDQTKSIQVHKSVRDYCDKEGHHFFPDAHFIMGSICLHYLSTGEFYLPSLSREKWLNLPEKHPFLNYSSKNWGWHLSRAGERRFLESTGPSSVMRFLQADRHSSMIAFGLHPALSDAHIWGEEEWESLNERGKAKFWALSALVYFDLRVTAEEWLNSSGNEVDPPEKCHHSALHLACRLGGDDKLEIVSLLLRKGADPARKLCRKLDEQTPIHSAAARNSQRVLEVLLDRHSELVRLENWRGRRPLSEAALHGNTTCVQIILDAINRMDDAETIITHQDNDGETVLTQPVTRGHSEVAEMLLSSKGGDSLKKLRTRSWKDTPLHLAAYHGKPDVIRLLLKHNLDTSAQQKQGKTPLFLAVQELFAKTGACAQILLDCTDPSIQDQDGRNVWHVAMELGRPRHVRQMMRKVPRNLLRIKDKKGRTPIIACLRSKRGMWKECIEIMIEDAADFFSPEEAEEAWTVLLAQKDSRRLGLLFGRFGDKWPSLQNGRTTVLHKAVETGAVQIVATTWERFPNREMLNSLDANGHTPLLLALSRRSPGVTEYLINTAKADVTVADSQGCTPLHWAVLSEMPGIAGVLVEQKALLDITDSRNITPFARASAKNSVRNLLQERSPGARPQSSPPRQVECLSHTHKDSIAVVGDEATKNWLTDTHGNPIHKVRLHSCEFTLTEPLPDDTKVPVTRVQISITAMDQGFSDHLENHPQDQHTFRNSHTWFNVALIRSGEYFSVLEVTRNRLAVGERSVYKATWDLEGGNNGDDSTSRSREPEFQDQVRNFVRELRPGDQIAIVAKCVSWRMWMNIVEEASVRVIYED